MLIIAEIQNFLLALLAFFHYTGQCNFRPHPCQHYFTLHSVVYFKDSMAKAKRDTSKKRESIITAATQAFCDLGYDATSMDFIAEVAGASKRTVYNHFPSKQELFQAVLSSSMKALIEQKNIPYDSNRTLEEQLAQFADAKLASVRTPAWLNLTKVVFSVFIKNPELARDTIAQAQEEGDALVLWLQKAEQDRKLCIGNHELAATVFWSMMTGGFVWPMVIGIEMEENAVRALKNEFIHTFLSRYSQTTDR